MAKTASPALFQLIRSLSQTEKRYFKLFIQKHVGGESGTYADLFDAIEKQAEYDENKLRAFPHLAVMKVRLEDTIMWSLRDFHSGKSVNVKLKADIRSIEILFDKGLLELAKRQIVKSKKTAEEYEDYLCLYELLRWELRIINAQAYSQVSEKELKQIYADAEDCLDKVKNAHQYALFSDTVYLQIRKFGFFRNKEEFKKFGKLMNNPMLKSKDKALSMDARYYYHSARIGFAELQSNYAEAYKNNRDILQQFESKPQLIRKELRKYLSMQQNLIVWQYQLKEFVQALVSLEKMKLFVVNQRTSLTENLFSRIFYYINTVLLLIYNRQGKYDTGVKAVTLFKKEFERYKVQPLNKESEWMFYDAAAAVYFGSGNFSEAIRYYNKIIQDNEGDIRNDMQCLTRIMSLIAHYELGNRELLRYMVKWTYRFLIKRNRLYKFETIILDFIGKKSRHMNTRKETVAAFQELKLELEKLLPDKFQRRPLDDFEYIEWLESKIQNRPFAEMVMKKAERK